MTAKRKLYARFGDPLTKSERRVLESMSDGRTAKSAGQTLGITVRTVNFHCANAYAKLGANNLIQACLEAGILERKTA
jgi:LuxR family quorum-sensing system transcriptional regulator SolR